MQGCILLSRKLIESEIWKKPPLYLKVWVYLLIRAQHAPYKDLKRGQLRVSIPEVVEICSYNVGYRKVSPTYKEVRNVFDWLRNPHEGTTKGTMIGTTKGTRKMLVTIENYDLYQTLKTYEGHDEGHHERITKGTTGAHYEQECIKNVNNDNINNNCRNTKKKTDIKFVATSFEIQLVDYLIGKIKEELPNARVPDIDDLSDKQKWAVHVDRMRRLDKRTDEDITKVVNYATSNSFWKTNILSTKKLRDKFDTLYAQCSKKTVTKVKTKQDQGMNAIAEWLEESQGVS